MPKTTYMPVTVTDANGITHTFQAGDEVPDELVERIDNEAVWQKPEGYDDTPDEGRPLGWQEQPGEPGVHSGPGSPSFADAPYATDEGVAPFQPDSGPVTEEGGNELTGEPAPDGPSESGQTGGGSSEADTATSKPSSSELDQMTRAELDRVATNLGLDPSGASSKAEVRSMIDSAPEPGDEG